MSVQAGPTEKRYDANGVTLAYTVPFLVIEAGDLQVFLNGVLQTSGYVHTGVGSPTSTITFTIAPAGDLYLLLNVPFQRLVDYQENGDFLASTVNRDFDRIWQALKQLLRLSGRSPILGENDIDGAGAYRAKGNRISDLADPIDEQDATTKRWAREYVTALISAIQGPINNALNIFFKGPDNLDYVVQDLAVVNILAKGGALVGYRGRTVTSKLDERLTVHDFGAIGDGVANDQPAFLAMFAFAGGVRFNRNKRYRVGNLALTGNSVFVIGEGQPSENSGETALEGGSVLLGNLTVRYNYGWIERFGLDAGSASGYPDGTEGLVVDALVGTNSEYLFAENICTLGNNPITTTHGFLFEGANKFHVKNIRVLRRYYGAVCKSRHGFIENVTYSNVAGPAVYVKSDTPAAGGFVADASVTDVTVRGVRGRGEPTSADAIGVYVHASTVGLSDVHVEDVDHFGKGAGLRIAGGVAPVVASGVTFDNIRSNGSEAVEFFGETYDTPGGTISSSNSASGKVFKTGGQTNGWRIEAAYNTVSLGSILGGVIADIAGTGSWGHIHNRNGAVSTQTVAYAVGVTNGSLSGNVKHLQEGTLPLTGGSWSAGAVPPTVEIGADNSFSLHGLVQNVVAVNTTITNTLPFGPLQPQKYIVPGTNGSDVDITVIVELTSSSITLKLPTLSLANIKTIDLSSITWKR